MLAVEHAKVNGAELLKKLAESGTGKGKLEAGNQVLAFVWKKYERVATANEVLDALETTGAPELTLKKAKAIAETGVWNPAAEQPDLPLYEVLAGGAKPVLPEEPQKPLVEQAAEAAEVFAPAAVAEEIGLKKAKAAAAPKKPSAE